MLRAIIYGLLSIILITLLRAVVGLIARAVNNALNTAASPEPAPRGGELRKCVVCGTYAPLSTGPKVKGVEEFFCSEGCVQKYRAA